MPIKQQRDGTRIYVKPRRDGDGLVVMQGKSYVVVGPEEVPMLIEAMQQCLADNHPA